MIARQTEAGLAWSTIHVAQSGRRRVSWLAIGALLCAVVAIVAPGAALASDGDLKLALTPVGQRGSFFDLTMRPGETRSLEVDIANDGDAPLAAKTYAADVYTIINGGFGGRLRDEPQTGTTDWLDYPAVVLELPAGTSTRRLFSVAVPAAAGPGEYITSLVLENDQPVRGDGAVTFDQIIRQAVAVVVTVPGPRSPALGIGKATHSLVAGKSVVAIGVENSGNVRLKPIVTFTLRDAAGAQVSHTSMPMDTFYAATKTFVEVQLATALLPGNYTLSLTLDDAAQSTRATEASIVLVVTPPPEPARDEGMVPGFTEVMQGTRDGQIPPVAWVVFLVASLLLVALVASLILVLRRHRGLRRPVMPGPAGDQSP